MASVVGAAPGAAFRPRHRAEEGVRAYRVWGIGCV